MQYVWKQDVSTTLPSSERSGPRRLTGGGAGTPKAHHVDSSIRNNLQSREQEN